MKPLSLIAILFLSLCYADSTKAASAYCREMEVRYINTSYDALGEIADKYPKNKGAVYNSFWYAVGYLYGLCTASIISKEIYVPYDNLRKLANDMFSIALDKMVGE